MRWFDPAGERTLWAGMCIYALLLFYGMVLILALLLRQRRHKMLAVAIPLTAVLYCLEQCIDIFTSGSIFSDTARKIIEAFGSLPDGAILLLLTAATVIEALFIYDINRRERTAITPMSVKEAMDTMPMGILFDAPGAPALLTNYAMHDIYAKATDQVLTAGVEFRERLETGDLLPDCRVVPLGEGRLLVLPDNMAYLLTECDVPYEKYTVHMMTAADISELYAKTRELEQMQKHVKALSEKLAKVNQEIVATTAAREILNARVKIHDTFGNNLLAITRYLTYGGTEAQKVELMASLRTDISFLKNDRERKAQDEYTLLFDTARRLGLTIHIRGTLPGEDPQKHIVATAMHESMTNTLRHAHGDTLTVDVTENDGTYQITIINNGEQPTAEITEKGGLVSLRELCERAGGRMTIRSVPELVLQLTLKKEADDGL